MMIIPVETMRRRALLIILETDNLERLQLADPIDLNPAKYFARNHTGPLEVVIAYEQDTWKLRELFEQHNYSEIIKYLQRGRRILPQSNKAHPPRILFGADEQLKI